MHKIYVDTRRDTVMLPVYGVMVPFHISTIKNVSKNEDDLRINFIAPGAPMAFGQKLLGMKDNVVYIREVTFHCPDTKGLNNSLRLIKELRKRFTQQKAHEQDVKTLQAQEKLILSKAGKNARLTDVYIRPNIAGRRTVGTVEVHQNGLRFSSVKGGQIDVLFGNIKHAFFQPAEHEMIVLIHFHLKTEIMVGKKKSKDVQFYVETMEMSHALDGTKKGGFDADEIEDEERERELRNKLNDEFQKFVRKVEEASGLDFDIPYRDLGFYGVPHRSAVFLQPTVNCLVHLTEAPSVVITLDDIEVAHFERVQFSLRNFDLVIVFKDYSFMHINSIPMESLDTIKEWLDSCNLKYYEGPQNLNWNRITAHIKDDPAKFYEEGGFEFLNTESSDEEGGGDDDSDEESGDFKPAESEGDESVSAADEDDSEEFSAVDEEEDSESGSGEEEDDDGGPTWDELEEKAREEDRTRGAIDERMGKRKRGEYSDDEDDKKGLKNKKPVPAGKPSAGAGPKKPLVSSAPKLGSKPGSKPAPRPLTSAKPAPRPLGGGSTASKPAPKPFLKK
jgi:nucleosome binding factor SPN SPT16 subunit